MDFVKTGKIVGAILTIIAALLGLVLGIWGTQIRQEIHKFKPVGSVGAITFGRVEGTEFLTISTPIYISNQGEQSGCIVDICIKLKEIHTKTTWTFFPAKVLKPGLYLIDKPEMQDIESPWFTVHLQGYRTFTKPLMFTHRPASKIPGQEKAEDVKAMTVHDLEPIQAYKLEMFALINEDACVIPDNPDYKLLVSEELTIKKFLIEELKNKSIPYFEIPLSKLDRIREQFIIKE